MLLGVLVHDSKTKSAMRTNNFGRQLALTFDKIPLLDLAEINRIGGRRCLALPRAG